MGKFEKKINTEQEEGLPDTEIARKFREAVKKKKAKDNPDYKGDNPETSEEVINDLSKMGNVKKFESKKVHDLGVFGTYEEPKEEKKEELKSQEQMEKDLIKAALGENVFERPDGELEKPKLHYHYKDAYDEQIASMTLKLRGLENPSELFNKKATPEQKEERQKLIEDLKNGIEEAKLRKEKFSTIKDKKPEKTEIKSKQLGKKEKHYIYKEVERLGKNIGLVKKELREAKTDEEKKIARAKLESSITEFEKAKEAWNRIKNLRSGGKKEIKTRPQVEADAAESQNKSAPEDLKEYIIKEKEIKRGQEMQEKDGPSLATPKSRQEEINRVWQEEEVLDNKKEKFDLTTPEGRQKEIERVQQEEAEKFLAAADKREEKIEEEIKKDKIIQNLDEKRKSYVLADKAFKETQKKEKIGLALKEIDLEKAKLEYEKVRGDYASLLRFEKIENLKKMGITENDPRFKEEMDLFKAALFEDVVIREQDKLAKEKVDELEPRKRTWFRTIIANYAKMSLYKKIAVSTGIATGLLTGGAALGIGGAYIAAMAAAPGAYAAQRFVKGIIGGKLAMLTGGLVKTIGTRKIEEWRKKELDDLNNRFGMNIENISQENEFQIMIRERSKEYENIVKETNRKHKNITKWSIAAGVLTGGLSAYGLTHVDASILSGGTVNQQPGIIKEEAPSKIPTDAGVNKALTNVGATKVSELSIEKGNIYEEIGNRGPEGAIIDYFRENPDIAVEKFGCPKELYGPNGEITDLAKFNEWAGGKAHRLWLEDAKEALTKPETLGKLKELGYSQDVEGYAKMMHRIGKGSIELDFKTGKIDLVDTEYLKARLDIGKDGQLLGETHGGGIKVPPEYFDGSKKMLYEEDIDRLNKKYPGTIKTSESGDIGVFDNVKKWLEGKAKIDVGKSSWLTEKFLENHKVGEILDSGFAKPQSVEMYTTAEPEWGSPQWWEIKEKGDLKNQVEKILRNIPIGERAEIKKLSLFEFFEKYLAK